MPNFCGYPDGPCELDYGEHLRHHGGTEETNRRKDAARSRERGEKKMSNLAKIEGGLSKQQPTVEGLETVLIEGDLAKLSTEQRITYYRRVCDSVGINPLTQPFEYLRLNGKMVLYARRACTDQLRNIHQISVKIVAREKVGDIYVVTAQASTPLGRCDESIGAVPLSNLSGENLANALMKAETKAKRRVTLAICGLSMMDETELDGVKAERAPRAGKPARTLDDVAGADPRGEFVELGDTIPEPAAEVEGELVDESSWEPPLFGLTPPTLPCPTFGPRATKKLQGKRWDVHDGAWLVQQWWESAEARDHFDEAMTAWGSHIVELRKRRHAHDEKQKAAAEQASSKETA